MADAAWQLRGAAVKVVFGHVGLISCNCVSGGTLSILVAFSVVACWS